MNRRLYWIAEVGGTVLVVSLLFFLAWQLRGSEFMAGTQQRYLIDRSVPVMMPTTIRHTVLQAACAQLTGELSDWQHKVCANIEPSGRQDVAAAFQSQLQQAQTQFASPLILDSDVSAQDWALARAGLLPKTKTEAEDDTAQFKWAEMYAQRYDLAKDKSGRWYSPALDCAINWLQQAPQGWQQTDADLMRAAILSGSVNKVRQGLNRLPALKHGFSDAWQSRCNGLGNPNSTMVLAAQTMSQAYISVENARKGELMLTLPERAGWILCLYGCVALLVLNFSRAPRLPLGVFTGIAIMLWSGAALLSQVFLSPSYPSWFWWGMMLAGGVMIVLSRFVPALQPRVLQCVTSRMGFPVFLLLLGIGWLVLLDLSTHAHAKNRYLALYQQLNLFVALMIVSILPAWRLEMMRLFSHFYARLLLMVDRWQLLKFFGAIVFVVVLAIVLRNQRQFTSELWRVWLVMGLGYFLCMRSTMIVKSIKDWWRPLSLILIVPFVGFVVTDDNGPLLVTLFGGVLLIGGLLGAFLRSEWNWAWGKSLLSGLGFSLVLGSLLTVFLFTLGQFHERTAERLASVFDPFSAVNDQMALIHNFRASIPNNGYGFGDVPWCGIVENKFCAGVPAQIQSDYTLTALQGVFGTTGWIFLLLGLVVVWWMRLLFNQRLAVKKQPELGGMTAANTQTWLSWMCLCWLVLLLFQLFITVSANLGFFPLTGITLPFVSYGSMSLWANSVFLALSLNVVLPKEQQV